MQLVVAVEEDVYSFHPADNGSHPMWCHGSTCLARIGDRLFASGVETLEGFKPLNNCRWTLFARDESGWRQVHADPVHRTREPSPLACFHDGSLFLSTNPTLVSDPDIPEGPARPEILEFSATEPAAPYQTHAPAWSGTPAFTEHSYRSLAADGAGRELILFQNVGLTHAEWTFRDGTGKWIRNGQLQWPWGAEYDTPQPIRVCYPNVALRAGAVHFCGVSDILEPYEAWRAYKRQLTGKEWDYDLRRLFYIGCPDIRNGLFTDWLEISSRDATCGWITPGDLWPAPDGAVHIVWSERAIDERLRDRFFPRAVQSHALQYAIVREGEVTERRPLVRAEEGQTGEIPSSPRFHVTPEERLFMVYYVSGADAADRPVSENRVMELYADGTEGPSVRIPLAHPLIRFFTPTVRGGSTASEVIDLLGTPVEEGRVCYARVKLYAC